MFASRGQRADSETYTVKSANRNWRITFAVLWIEVTVPVDAASRLGFWTFIALLIHTCMDPTSIHLRPSKDGVLWRKRIISCNVSLVILMGCTRIGTNSFVRDKGQVLNLLYSACIRMQYHFDCLSCPGPRRRQSATTVERGTVFIKFASVPNSKLKLGSRISLSIRTSTNEALILHLYSIYQGTLLDRPMCRHT